MSIEYVLQIRPFFVQMQFYSSGLFDTYRCSSYDINHAMLIIGYGRTSGDREYWMVKNR